jgi:chemosensory pili system protein ChpC
MSTPESEVVSCVRLPLAEGFLLLPSLALEAVVGFQVPTRLDGGAPWLLGTMPWRDRSLPVMTLGPAGADSDAAPRRRPHVVVVKALGGHPRLTHYGILIRGFPQAVAVDRSNLAPRPRDTDDPRVLCAVALDGEPGFIPDLDRLEQDLLDALDAATPPS